MSQDRPAILLLTVDSLRADHCGFLNPECDLTPTLDRLAEDGVVFENAIAPGPRTPSSMPEIFTGEVFGPRPQVEEWNLRGRKSRISTHLARFQTVAERLQEQGYNTSGVTANPWTQYLPDATFEKGFDEYTEIDGRDLFNPDTGAVPRALVPFDKALNVTGVGERYNWRWKKDWFIQWPHIYDLLSERFVETSSPSFFWVFLLDTHEPYLSPGDVRKENNTLEMYYAVVKDKLDSGAGDALSQSDRERLRRAYQDATRSVDRFVEAFLDECDEDSIVIFHSDHGEAFGEHGTWGHKPELYRENLHVPFLISGVEPERVREPVSLRDIPAMVADIASDPEGFDPNDYTDDFAYATTENGETRALSGSRWKYIAGPDGAELYSLADDPDERTDVSDEHEELVHWFDRIDRSHRTRVNEKASIADAVEAVEGT